MGALPKALSRRGHRVMVVAPRYGEYAEGWETGVRRQIRVFNSDQEVRSLFTAHATVVCERQIRVFNSDQEVRALSQSHATVICDMISSLQPQTRPSAVGVVSSRDRNRQHGS